MDGGGDTMTKPTINTNVPIMPRFKEPLVDRATSVLLTTTPGESQ